MRPAPPDRLSRALSRVRRVVLRRRRLLAALLTAVAVAAGLNAVAGPPPETVTVLVAARDLPSGTELTTADVRTAEFVPGSAPSDLVDDPVGRVLAAPLTAGEPVTDVRLVGPQLTDDLPGLTAVPVRLPDAGMVGLLEVGDRIDLVAADPQAGGAQVVAADVLVLALPAAGTDEVGASDLPGRLVVVGASTSEAEPIADAAVRSFVTYTWARR